MLRIAIIDQGYSSIKYATSETTWMTFTRDNFHVELFDYKNVKITDASNEKIGEKLSVGEYHLVAYDLHVRVLISKV